MKISYDRFADAVYINVTNQKVVTSKTISSGVVYDYDENDEIIGIEILGFRKRTPERLKELSCSLTDEVREMPGDLSSSLSALSA